MSYLGRRHMSMSIVTRSPGNDERTRHRTRGRRASAAGALLSSARVPAPIHLRPTAPLAERALLPGDPGRALALAQALFESPPKMFNHHRGLWGYTGTALDGEPLTVQSTGLGGPSGAIVVEELSMLGLRRAVRVGTCTAIAGGIALGDTIAVAEALAADGASRALGAGDRIAADGALAAALRRSADHAGAVVSTDLFYDGAAAAPAAAALASDLQTAAVLAAARRAGVQAGAVLAAVRRGDEQLDDEPAAAAALRAAEGALAALGSA
jgi:uridine phosphorylase